MTETFAFTGMSAGANGTVELTFTKTVKEGTTVIAIETVKFAAVPTSHATSK